MQQDGRVTGVKVEDTLTGDTFAIRSSVVVNAAGPWAANSLASFPAAARGAPPPRLSRAMNVITSEVVHDHACGGLANGRYLFMIPWRDVSMIGTSHDSHDDAADQLKVSRWDLEAFLKDAREAFPHADMTTADVRLIHRGLLPMIAGEGSEVQLMKESRVVDHSKHGLPGLVSMFGVRYTTARQTAQEAVDTVFRALGHQTPPPCRTAETPLQGGSISRMDTFLRAVAQRDIDGIPAATLQRIARTYGTGYDRVLQVVREFLSLARPSAAVAM